MYFSKIKRIKSIGIKETGDLRVPNYHNYILANGIVTHNSGKSSFAQAIGYYLDQSLNIDRVVFSGVDLMIAIDNAPKGTVIIYDEAIMDMSCQPIGSRVLMSNGDWKNIEDVKIGERVISPQENGEYIFAEVKEITTFKTDDIYEVKHYCEKGYKNRQIYRCTGNHKIPIGMHNGMKEVKKLITPGEYNSLCASYQKKRCIFTYSMTEINTFEGVKDCEIEPYTLGVYLGNGCYSQWEGLQYSKLRKKSYYRHGEKLSIVSKNDDVMKKVSEFYPYIHVRKPNESKSYGYSLNSPLKYLLKKYGLAGKKSYDKFIPDQAKKSSLEYRKKLISGLIDTDTAFCNNSYVYTSTSRRLVEDIYDVIKSLGYRSSGINLIYRENAPFGMKNHVMYGIRFSILKNDLFIQNKKKQVQGYVNGSMKETNRVYISIKKVDTFEQVYGLKIEGDSKLYVTNEYLITHNSQDAATDMQKILIKKFTTIRKKSLYIILVIPSVFMLRKYFAIFRTRFMLNCYCPDGITRGRFRFYSWDTKKKLYLIGMKEMNMGAVRPDFWGNFTDTYGYFVDPAAYENKKDAAIRALTTDKNSKEIRMKEEFMDYKLKLKIEVESFKGKMKDKFGEQKAKFIKDLNELKKKYQTGLVSIQKESVKVQSSNVAKRLQKSIQNMDRVMAYQYIMEKNRYEKVNFGKQYSEQMYALFLIHNKVIDEPPTIIKKCVEDGQALLDLEGVT